MNTSRARIITILAFTLLVSSCGADSDNADAGAKRSSPGSLVPARAGIPADGKVSRKEYETAFDDAISCLRESRFIVARPKLDRSGFLLKYDAEAQGMSDSRVAAESQRCEETYLTVASDAYIDGHLDELRSAESLAQQKLVACLSAKEIVVDSTDTNGALTRLRTSHPAEIAQCEG